MATGQRVVVVPAAKPLSSVLKNQLPAEVQPLAISVLSSEREGLRQVESAIREIQGVVEGSQPQNRRADDRPHRSRARWATPAHRGDRC